MSANRLSRALAAQLKRDLKVAYRGKSSVLNPIVFFIIVTSIFPMGIGPVPPLLTLIGPGVIWVSALLATLLALEGLFQGDHDDGYLEQLLLSHYPLPLLVLAKVGSHWLISGLPLVIVAPILALLLNIDLSAICVMILALLIGTLTLSLVGAVGAALLVGTGKGGLLLSLLVLPLYVPVLIFGASAVGSATKGIPFLGELYALGALLALALTFAPIAISAALRASLD
ncbi:MAG: heme exporter protein CcmB [Acidiferrobacteraceae bacterium]|nr:heme exporter protein CcmB [Acidiferrobacteraceae bacterium]